MEIISLSCRDLPTWRGRFSTLTARNLPTPSGSGVLLATQHAAVVLRRAWASRILTHGRERFAKGALLDGLTPLILVSTEMENRSSATFPVQYPVRLRSKWPTTRSLRCVQVFDRFRSCPIDLKRCQIQTPLTDTGPEKQREHA